MRPPLASQNAAKAFFFRKKTDQLFLFYLFIFIYLKTFATKDKLTGDKQ
jgi:hypothetical protein